MYKSKAGTLWQYVVLFFFWLMNVIYISPIRENMYIYIYIFVIQFQMTDEQRKFHAFIIAYRPSLVESGKIVSSMFIN